ncbi:hypothetical protein OKA06_19840 [Novosphingobium sp. MW5]|nr:hypothetical protein [Novosphingobium sp. MW5]
MNRFALATALVTTLAPIAAFATPEGWSRLMEPAQLNTLLDEYGDEIRVVQITGEYGEGHIPGSGWSPYASWRSDMPNPGALRDLGHLTTIVQELGIDTDTPVAVVHAGRDATDMGALGGAGLLDPALDGDRRPGPAQRWSDRLDASGPADRDG